MNRKTTERPERAEPTWRDQANCAGADPHLFAERERGTTTARRAHRKAEKFVDLKLTAVRYCLPCVAKTACAANADEHENWAFGLRAGVYRTGSVGDIRRYDLLDAEWITEAAS